MVMLECYTSWVLGRWGNGYARVLYIVGSRTLVIYCVVIGMLFRILVLIHIILYIIETKIRGRKSKKC
jgi:hypothetical protein